MIKARKKSLHSKLSSAAKDSVVFDLKVHAPDSVEFSVYLVSRNPSNKVTISDKHGVGEYCNDKVVLFIENAVFEVTRRWFNVSKKDTLRISATVIGEADDIWGNKDERQTFRTECRGVGAKIGIKVGDKISNDTIALLRAVSAEMSLQTGMQKTESFLSKKGRKSHVELMSAVLTSKDWLVDEKPQIGPRFRKETIVLKCECH